MTASTMPVIDASVHVHFRSNADLRAHLRPPFATRGFPDYELSWYAAPDGEFAPEAERIGSDYPCSDPEVTGRQLFVERGVDVAVLHPMTRGNVPDRHLGSALAAATNEMLVSRWLESGTYADRYRGTIRVCVEDVDGAVREIARWKDHPRVVQIGVPLQTRDLYGHPRYEPIWRAAAAAGLPVAVHIEMGVGVDHGPTPSGRVRTYPQYVGFMALNYLYHLMNLIAEGVFERLDLKVVFADGGGDLLTPFSWRMDTFGRPHLEMTPWAPRIPSDYLSGHAHFVQSGVDGPPNPEAAAEWLAMTGKEDMLLYGSSYPHWLHTDEAGSWTTGLTAEQREKVLFRNAAALYGIDVPTPVG